MKQKTCAEIIAETEEKINNTPVLKAACKYSESVKKPVTIYGFGKVALIEAFQAGAEWQLKQNLWRNFKDELPKPNSHILRKMIHPDYQVYGKVIYYADFWGEDRPNKWEQDNDKVVYEWQYINE
jgi:hypothetical protein